jgi:hypothetical protein
MDPQRLKQAYQQLELLEERLGYKVNPRYSKSLMSPSTDQVDQRLRDLAAFTVELKDVVRELFLAIASKPSPIPKPPSGEA